MTHAITAVARGDLLQARGLAEGAQEFAALRGGTAEASPLAEDDRPGPDAAEEEKAKDGEGDGSAVAEHFHEGAAGGGLGHGSSSVSLEEKECEEEVCHCCSLIKLPEDGVEGTAGTGQVDER